VTHSTRLALALALSAPAMLCAAPATAQAQRTWVSGSGSDAADCSRATPCQTFAGAYAKTAIEGEINCVDAAGYGVLQILHSISIVCDGTESGIVSNSTNAVVILTQFGDKVLISGLDITGSGNGFNGILVAGQGTTTLRNVAIHNMQTRGIRFEAGGITRLVLENVLIANNGSSADPTSAGLFVSPPFAGGVPSLIMDNVRIINNVGAGLRVDAVGHANIVVRVTARHSQFTGNAAGLLVKGATGGSSLSVVLDDVSISGNSNGIIVNGLGSSVVVGGSLITENNTALLALQGGDLVSYGDNLLVLNNIDGAFTGTPVVKK
jgi:hypothetical protein